MRVRVDQDKADLLKSLLQSSDNPQGVFATYADILVFTAILGRKYRQKIPLETIAKEPNPISLEVFHSRGYQFLLNLLTIVETNDLQSLATNNIDSESQMITIFEEYANGGLYLLEQKLQGAIDYSERILLILSQEMNNNTESEEFDLRKFLP